MKRKESINRGEKAVTLIELAMGLMVLLPVILLVIDLTMITLAVQINDSAAREASRMAASGDPNFAQVRAQQVINRLNSGTSGFISNITMSQLVFNPTTLPAKATSLASYGGVISGKVTVMTQATVTPFLIEYVYKGPYAFQSSQTCPITYTVPNTAGGLAVSQ